MVSLKKRFRRVGLAAVAIVAVASQFGFQLEASAKPRPSEEALHVVQETAAYDPTTGVVRFSLTFDRRTDLADVDEFGQRVDQFQYHIIGDATLDYPYKYDAIVRVESPALELVIRNATPSASDPDAGGWGTVRATVPYRFQGRTLNFYAPLSALSDHSTDGHFAYELETYRNGFLADHIDGASTVLTK